MPPLELHVAANFSAAPSRFSMRVLETASMFGLGIDPQRRLCIVPSAVVQIPLPGIVFITGPSGSGKSTLLRELREQCQGRDLEIIEFADSLQTDDDQPIVDLLGGTLERAHGLLARVGLADAFTLLRAPGQLSAGQRHRFELARIMERADGLGAQGRSAIIFADEFCALLDRRTAQTISQQLRRWISCGSHALICAAAHEDLLEALQPDVLIWKGFGEEMTVASK